MSQSSEHLWDDWDDRDDPGDHMETRLIIKLDVTRSYVKRQTAKMKLSRSVFSSLNSGLKLFVFVAKSRRHVSIFM